MIGFIYEVLVKKYQPHSFDFLIVFVSWHYFKKSASLIKQIKNKSVVMAYCMDGDTPVCDDSK
jgi:hypothetical protein